MAISNSYDQVVKDKQKKTAELGWDKYIDQANMSGNDALREQYIRFRDAGIDAGTVKAKPGVELGGGYTYNPMYGSISLAGDNGYAYKYDPNSKTTTYNGKSFNGAYDPNILQTISDDEWTAAENQWKSDYESREGTIYNMSDAQALKYYGNVQSNMGDAQTVDYSNKLGKVEQDLYDQYQNNILKTAYEQAQSRYSGEDIFSQILQGDYTDQYKLPDVPTSQFVQNVLNNASLSDSVKQAIIKNADPSYKFNASTPAAASTPATEQSPTTTYANELLGEPATETVAKEQTPWSSDFEKQFLDQLQGLGTSVDNYLTNKGTTASTPTYTNFSLGQYRDGGLNTGTPTVFGKSTTPSTSSTGKTGTGNTTSLWS